MNDRGFTLVELVIAVAALSIILLGVSQFYFTAFSYGRENDAQAYLQRQADIIVDEMARHVRTAKSLEIATCSGVNNALKATQPDYSVYCFYVDGSGKLIENRPSGSWDLLMGSPVSLTVPSFDLCGTTPPSGTFATCQTTSGMAYVSFELKDTYQNSMRFTTTLARRN
jgi:prepilin-type N-terminal cleavage/methylation domain-containing protein